MIDLHSHLLPGLDDGARNHAQALLALRLLGEDGVTEVVCTPHLRAGEVADGGERAIERRDLALRSLRDLAPSGPALHAGFEIMLDEPPGGRLIGDRRYALAGSLYYLVEFRLGVVAHLATHILADMMCAGVIPLVAHVERYGACSPVVVAQWKDAGARIQVDATTLTRPTSRGRLARSLLGAGLVDVLAADNHGDGRSLRTAVRFLRERGADRGVEVDEALLRLTESNPRAVLNGTSMTDVPGIGIDEGWLGRIRRFFGR